MELFTRNQRIFALCTVLQSVPFFYFLNQFLDHGAFGHVIMVSLIFGLALFITGFLLGHRDKGQGRFSLGFGYHLITYLIVNLMGAIFLVNYTGVDFRGGLVMGGNLIFWGIGLVVHYLFERKDEGRF